MELLDYDENELAEKLGRLSIPHRTAFAAAIAERLLPAYLPFTQRTGRGNPAALKELLDDLWGDLEGHTATTKQEQGIELCMSLIPDEDQEPWVTEQVYADDASAALVYALRSRKDGQVQDVVWAARRSYDALDHFVTNLEGVDVNEPGAEQRVLSHHLVQAELSRQQRDLRELAATEMDLPQVAERLRNRAKAESASVFIRVYH
jgi:uncharacterized protein YjaG (DUF416 family)